MWSARSCSGATTASSRRWSGRGEVEKRSLGIHPHWRLTRRHQHSEMTAVRNLLLKSFGISAAAAALAVFGYSAQVQAQAAKKEEPKAAAKKEPAKKPPPACTTLKTEAACKGPDDCVWTPEGVDAKTKKKTKAACKAKPKDKKADPKKK